MSDNFDKKLANRINHVFDNYEEDSAAQGWAKLREKFPQKNKRRPVIIWFSSAAAVLLILCGTWFFSDQQNATISKVIKPIKKPAIYNQDPEATISNDTIATSQSKVEIGNVQQQKDIQSQKLTGIRSSKHFSRSTNRGYIQKASKTSVKTSAKEVIEQANNEEAEHNLTVFALAPKKHASSDSMIAPAAPHPVVQLAETNNSTQITASNSNATEAAVMVPENGIKEKINTSTKTALIKSQKTKRQPRNSTKGFAFGVFGESYLNYSEGSQSTLSTGIGLSTEFSISRKLKLATGVSLAKNSFNYSQAIPIQAASNFSKVSNKGGKFNDYYAVSADAINGYVSTKSYIIDTYNAKLVGLDIPINLKYSLKERTKSIYVVAGLSSNYFLNETYTYGYNYLRNDAASQSQTLQTQAPVEQKTTNFNSFDFARMLNLSLGFEYPMNKAARLSFEPFIKYPLAGLGSHDLRFGAAGMNLKVNFVSSKKARK